MDLWSTAQPQSEDAALLQQGYILNRLPVGAVTLDGDGRVVSFNDTAASILGGAALHASVGKPICSVHSANSRAKIEWLLRQADNDEGLGAASMIIDLPDRVLQLRVVSLKHGHKSGGYCLIVYDITGLIPAPREPKPASGDTLPLKPFFKVPVSMKDRVVLLDVDQVSFLQAEGHYSHVHTATKRFFCNLPLSQLELRLPERFVRVHRSYIINIARASGVSNRDNQLVIAIEGEPGHEIPVSRNNAPRLRHLLGV
jgi:LytTR family transcriptional regulator, CO-responsive transcriptional regulator RcoM